MAVDIEKLFDTSRFPNGISLIPILLYFPFGICLAILRIFIGLHAYIVACVLPKRLPIRNRILRVLCAVVGIVVWVEDKRDKGEASPPLLIANHASIMDHLAMDLVIPNITPSVWNLPSGLAWLLGYRDMGVTKGTENLVENVKRHCSESSLPVLVFPEGGTTNGAVGLLKFSAWPFTVSEPIQPVAVKIQRFALIPVAISPLGSRWWSDVFWFLFSPYSLFKLTLLPVMEKHDDEEPADFARRTERCIAARLDIHTTQHTDRDKMEYTKRSLFTERTIEATSWSRENNRRGMNGSNSMHTEPEIQMLASQVKTVLPDIPLHVIQADIARTRNVDETITNLLEGDATYKEKRPTPIVSETLVFSADQFSNNTSSRQLSFKERKQLMLDTARARYKEKHDLL